MKFDAKTWIIAGLLLLVIVLILFQPSKPVDITEGKAFKEAISKLEAEKAQKAAQVATLFKESESKDSTVKVELRAKDKEISLLKVKASRHVANIPTEVRAQNPSIDSALAAKDSVIATVEAKNDDLRRAHDFQVLKIKELQTLIVDKDRIANEMYSACAAQLDKADRLANREHKKANIFKKIAGVLGIIALTEAALIAIQ